MQVHTVPVQGTLLKKNVVLNRERARERERDMQRPPRSDLKPERPLSAVWHMVSALKLHFLLIVFFV